jgi:type VI secretion system secreted protein VgrG
LVVLAIAAFTAVFCGPTAGFASILLSADEFAVLAGSTVTNTGSSTINGDVGVWGGTAITGEGPGADQIKLTGVYHAGDAVAQQAQGDVTAAYNGLAGMPVNSTLTGQNLGGLTLAPGVYKYSSDAQLTGTLFLDAQGNNNVFWVFQIGTALTTASSSAVQFVNLGTNGGIDNGVFWQVGSSATLGVGTAFEGNILAKQSISLDTGATISNGRALARIAAVTLDTNTIDSVNGGSGFNGGLNYDSNGKIVPVGPTQGGGGVVPEPCTMLLFGLGSVATAFMRRRRKV